MSDLQTRFNKAATDAQALSTRPSNDVMLKLYALYKQASQGDVIGKRPGFTNPVGRAKHDAWGMLQGKSQEEAMEEYIALVTSLQD